MVGTGMNDRPSNFGNHDEAAAVEIGDLEPGPAGIEGVTFIGTSKILLMIEDTTFPDHTGKGAAREPHGPHRP